MGEEKRADKRYGVFIRPLQCVEADCIRSEVTINDISTSGIGITTSGRLVKDQKVELELVIEDRKNMLRDITQAIADSDTNVCAAEIHAQDTTATGKFVVEVASLSHLNRIIDRVRKIKGVISIVRTKGRDSKPS